MLLEIATDDTLSTGMEGTKLCLSYTKVLLKQLTEPTAEDKEFAYSLIECLNGTIKEGEDRGKMWTQFFILRS